MEPILVKDIVVESNSPYDTLIADNGTQYTIKKGQSELIGRKVTIENGVLTEAAPEIKRKPIAR